MASAVARDRVEPWRRRLYLPNYQLREAAKYADISTQTVAKWHEVAAPKGAVLSRRESGSELSYMQLVEVAVVSAFRKAGLTLTRIRAAREYVSQQLKSEFPFAEYRFKTDGKELWVDYDQVEGSRGADKLLETTRGGQLAWKEVIDRRLREFEYENGGVAIRWRVAGPESPIVIDPRVGFGAPSVDGTPTWIIKGRWDAGESIADIAEDFGISEDLVRGALAFERFTPDPSRKNLWAN